MIRKLLFFLLPIGLLIVLASGVMSDNGIAGKVGSSGENRCTECHSTYAINSGTGSIQLRTGMINNQYVPGQVYTLVFKVAFPGRSLFGMGLEALTSTNTNAGTFTMTTNKTTTKSVTIGTTSRRSVVHTFNGGISADSMLFTFNWTAPASGTVTFYYCGVAANASTTDAGDYVYSGTMVVNPVSTTGISENISINTFNAFPNPVADRLNVEFTPVSSGDAAVTLYDLSGKVIRTEEMSVIREKSTSLSWSSMDELPAGTYLLTIRNGEAFGTRRIVIL
jgi:hypothetical protein